MADILHLPWENGSEVFANCSLDYAPVDALRDYFTTHFAEKLNDAGVTGLANAVLPFAQAWNIEGGNTAEMVEFTCENYRDDSITFIAIVRWYDENGEKIGEEVLPGKARQGKDGLVGTITFDDLQSTHFVATGVAQWDAAAA